MKRFPDKLVIEIDLTDDSFFQMGFMWRVKETLKEVVRNLPDTSEIGPEGDRAEGNVISVRGDKIGTWRMIDEDRTKTG